jgi:hypothetical protein
MMETCPFLIGEVSGWSYYLRPDAHDALTCETAQRK